MAQEKKRFFGGMDFDTESRFLKDGDYRVAINMKTSGENDSLGVLENIVGSEFVNHASNTIQVNSSGVVSLGGSFSMPAGARVIGKYRDETHDRIIYITWESGAGAGSILEYSQKENAISVIVDGYSFGFDDDFLITGINVVAHDEPWAPDGLLYWTDGKNEPRKINIAKAKILAGSANISSGKYYSAHHYYGIDTELVGGYTSLTSQNISAVKYPPVYSPDADFGTDTSINTNKVINKQWQFKYRYVYDDKEKSAWSPISKIKTSSTGTALGAVSIAQDNYIDVTFNSGSKEVRFIEIAARTPELKTDFFVVDRVPTYSHTTPPTTGLNNNVYYSSAVSAISAVDTDYQYRFYNNGIYESVDLKDSIKPYDNVPLKAKSQEIIDGNRIVYGDVVDGREGVDSTDSNIDLFYKEGASASVTTNLLNYTTNVDAFGTVTSGGSGIKTCKYAVKLDFSSIMVGGLSPANSNVNISVNNMGWIYCFGIDSTIMGNEGNIGEGTISFGYSASSLPSMTDVLFAQTIKDSLLSSYPSVTDVMSQLHLERFIGSSGNQGTAPELLPGHPTTGTGAPDGELWKVVGTEVHLRFTVRNVDGVTTTGTNLDLGFGIGFDWAPGSFGGTTFSASTSSGTNTSPTVAYAGGTQIDISSGAPFMTSYTQQYIQLQPATSAWSPHLAGNDMILMEHFSLSGMSADDMGFKSGSYHDIGVVYYDEANRSSTVQRLHHNNYIPFFTDRPTGVDFNPAALKVEIKHEAPSWAKTWQIVYGGNRNIEKFWQFRINGVSIVNGRYILGIKPLNDVVTKSGLEALYYDFVDGDRIRPIADGANTLSASDIDLKIVGSMSRFPEALSLLGDYDPASYNSALEITTDVATAGTTWVGDLAANPTNGLLVDAGAANLAGGAALTSFFEGGLIEVYRPRKDVEEGDVFYHEIGEVHPVVFDSGSSEYRHHVSNTTSYSNLFNSSGTSGQTVTNAHQTALNTNGSGAIVFLNRGDVYHRFRASVITGNVDFIEDFNASDFFKSDNYDAGRPNIVNPQFKETHRPSTVFYSDPLIPNTNINGLSSIFPDDYYEEFDKNYGSIQKLHSRENQLIIFQEDKVSRAQTNRDIITTGSGDQILTAEGAIISQAIPYAGEYGISTNPESFAEYAEVLYFTDVRRGSVCRLSQNGITPISEYQMKNYFTDLFRILSRANITSSTQPDRIAKLYGSFNPKDKEYMLSLDLHDWNTIFNNTPISEGIYEEVENSSFFDDFGIKNTYSSNTQAMSIGALKKKSLAKRTVVFSENSNRWTYFMDIYGMCEYLNNEVINLTPSMSSGTTAGSVGGSHNGANLYVLRRENWDTTTSNPNNYGEFYSEETGGTQTGGKNIVQSQAIFVSNVEPSINKVYNSIGVECSFPPSNFEIQNSYRQYSIIFSSYWKTKENAHYSAIYGDINSFNAYDGGNQYAGIINGEKIRGREATIRMAWRQSSYLRLFSANISVTPSEKSGVI